MKFLELKIPPIFIVLIAMLGIYFSSHKNLDHQVKELWVLLLTISLTIGGMVFCLLGLLEFRKNKTTVDPMRPQKCSSIVDSGIYRFTRNPMYLGFLLIILSLGIYLEQLYTPLFCIFYLLYMTRFQIMPEERALLEKFGDCYLDYKKSVRRWI